MANNLFQYFQRIRDLPLLDARGFLAFRSYKELDKVSKEMEQEKQSLCLTLSYFYSRIFQIYGALALTLIDDVQYMTSTGIVQMKPTDFLPTPGMQPYHIQQPLRLRGGGPNREELGNFYFLTNILSSTKEDLGYRVLYRADKTTKDEIFFKIIKPKDDKENSSELTRQEGRFAIGYDGAPDYARFYIKASKMAGSNQIRVEFGEIRYLTSQGAERTDIPPVDVVKDKTIIVYPSKPDSDPTQYKLVQPAIQMDVYFKARLDKIMSYIKKLMGYRAGFKDATTTSDSDSFPDTGGDPQLSLTRIHSNLAKDRPPGHCVARALQLLRTPLLSDRDGVSSMCKVRFYQTGKETTRAGLPSPGGLIAASSKESEKPGSAGIAATAQLFYNFVSSGTPQLIIGNRRLAQGQPSALEQYTRFVRLMAHVFDDNHDAQGKELSNEDIQRAGIAGIHNRTDSKVCKGLPADDISVPNRIAQEVYKKVRALFRIQLDHAAKCTGIIKQLFGIQYDSTGRLISIKFSDNLMQKGLPELERISYEAREVLIQYYARCESTYREGANMIAEQYRKDRAPPVPFCTQKAGPALPSAPPMAQAVKPKQPVQMKGGNKRKTRKASK